MAIERSWQLICDECGNNSGDRYAVGDLRMFPSKLKRSLRANGWTFHTGRDLCEKCSAALTQEKQP